MQFVSFAEQAIEPFDKDFSEDIIEGDPKQRSGATLSALTAPSSPACGTARQVCFAG